MTTLLLSLLLTPAISLAQQPEMTLRDHAVLRAVERIGIGTDFGIRTQTIRLGHNVRTRRMSPRRTRSSTTGKVLSVVDGSLLEVRLFDGRTVTVRTLGSEAPLLTSGTDKEQCFALEAKSKLAQMVLGKNVELEKDRNYNGDNYGRWLRYVRLNSLDIGNWMIGNGNAFADSRNGHRRQASYHASQEEAMDYERGLWGHICEYNDDLDTIEALQ
ncbi:MAG: hypothetical protein HOG89_01615 [Candidatus Peribacter sp.]|nr:hypothetical protein [Candidatus Peribacter sp.]MBT4392507.1 hypothetical protein [Candidatus Peribacter sp.]MBT4601336.1 hypothetical protein [Candidatus Peribacter sp.]MBT5149212.1 hypothetical protein [Candidatus Peribacter sp.]MBT5638062.1 hypothetical protein [Candidatus Peribacter sp.]